MKPTLVMIAVVVFLSGRVGAQVTVNYQPTPYPNSVDGDVHHVVDGWLGSNFNTLFVRDDKVQVGGWGDIYRTYLKFDLEGLPGNVSQAKLWFKNFARGDASTTTSFVLARVSSPWDENMTWATQPSTGPSVTYSPATVGLWWGMDITSWYQAWQQGSAASHGVMLSPSNTNNRFNMFRSSRYSSAERPYLQLTFTQPVSTPAFRMPLPGGVAWLNTTEVGGYDCKGLYDQYHDGTNYFSIDFSWRNVDPGSLSQVYSSTDNIPIIAAASGIVTFAGYSNANGNYVVLDHDNDNNVGTGFSTRYLHLKPQLFVSTGQSVNQGDLLGYMGDTGISYGTHLHFGVRYNDSGSSSQSPLRYVVMDGRLLKSYQSSCANNSASGDYTRYYTSLNRAY
jgi:murein DD-endopeptidase MepM/ murein hydrolase activator NlpD